MGSSQSRTGQEGERLAAIRARLSQRRQRRPTDSKSSQLSDMLPEILEMIFAYFVDDSDGIGLPRSTLLTIGRVNRHWARTAQALLYRSITLTKSREVALLLRTLSKNPGLEGIITQLRIPELLELESLRTHNHAGFRLSDEQQRKAEASARCLAVADVLRLLGILTNLNYLELHADNVQLYIDRPDGLIQRTKPLTNLETLNSLILHGRHDGRWLFLMKFAPYLSHLRVSPCWGWEHSESLPFSSYNLKTLHLTNDEGPEESDNRMTSTLFDKLLSIPAHLLRRSISSRSSFSATVDYGSLRTLTLIDIPTILPDLHNHLRRLSSTLEYLHIAYHTPKELQTMSLILRDRLPELSALQTLRTNATSEGLARFPPSLISLTVSLKARPVVRTRGSSRPASPTLTLVDEPINPSSPVLESFNADASIGSIYQTINGILDIVATSRGHRRYSVPHVVSPRAMASLAPSRSMCTPSPLSELTIVDSTMEDFLHFHLIGDDGYDSDDGPNVDDDAASADFPHYPKRSERRKTQNRMWMKAGQLGVLVDVVKPGSKRR